MEDEQKTYYLNALAHAMKLVVGPRDADYNKGGIGLRDYWQVNGICSPLQMVDMKVKRALSQVRSWTAPPTKEQVAKVMESMADAINYAAFTVCEAASQCPDEISFPEMQLAVDLEKLLSGEKGNG